VQSQELKDYCVQTCRAFFITLNIIMNSSSLDCLESVTQFVLLVNCGNGKLYKYICIVHCHKVSNTPCMLVTREQPVFKPRLKDT